MNYENLGNNKTANIYLKSTFLLLISIIESDILDLVEGDSLSHQLTCKGNNKIRVKQRSYSYKQSFEN